MVSKRVDPMSTVAIGRRADCFELRVMNGVEVWLIEGLGERHRAFYGDTYSDDTPGAPWREAMEDLVAAADAPIERVEVHERLVIVVYKSWTRRECDVAEVIEHADEGG